MSERHIVDCTQVKDDFGRTKAPLGITRPMTTEEQSQYDTLQLNPITVPANAAFMQQQASDLEVVRLAGLPPLGTPVFTSLYRLLGGTA